jgi:hypothetical protein
MPAGMKKILGRSFKTAATDRELKNGSELRSLSD